MILNLLALKFKYRRFEHLNHKREVSCIPFRSVEGTTLVKLQKPFEMQPVYA
jgi:hypothetical protein